MLIENMNINQKRPYYRYLSNVDIREIAYNFCQTLDIFADKCY